MANNDSQINKSEPKLDIYDRPIDSLKQDKLNRQKTVQAIINTIKQTRNQNSSLTIGVEGSWGSGKTSIINFVKEELEKDKNYVFLDFNPWMHLGIGDILTDFFASLKFCLAKTVDEKDKVLQEKVMHKAKEYGEKLLNGASLKVNVLGIAEFSTQSKERKKEEGEEESLSVKKQNLIKELNEIPNKKIICIIDDIDRLDVEETLLIFKLTKILADFPNMIFLLAYDRQRTAELISQKFTPPHSNTRGGDIGNLYIKKIIQMVRLVPDTTNTREFFEGQTKLTRLYIAKDNKHLLDDIMPIYDEYLERLLQTPRDVKRFLSQIDSIYSINNFDHVDVPTLMLIEAMRMTEGKVYESVKFNKKTLLAQNSLDNSEVNLLNELIEGRDMDSAKFSGYDWGRCDTIKDILGESSSKNYIIMLNIIIYILSATPPKSNGKREVYSHLKPDWDLYFSAGGSPRLSEKQATSPEEW